MDLIFEYGNMMREMIGSRGISENDIVKDQEEIQRAYSAVKNGDGKGMQEWALMPERDALALEEVSAYAKIVRERAESFVILGIGGSALGPLAVSAALLHLRHNELPKAVTHVPKLYIEDNIDPERMNSLLDVIDLKNTYFNVITKSGETSETLSQFIILYKLLKDALGELEAKKHIVVTTTVGKGTLYQIALEENFKLFHIEAGVGGRFSVLSNVGLFPFAVMGIDIRRLLEGAEDMREVCLRTDIAQNPALLTAYLQVKSMQQGKNISVCLPYADSLRYMADFYAQLWGESLGKKYDQQGKVVHCGQTPVKALGVTDQHSQIQLYTEGPDDKVITILSVERYRDEIVIPHDKELEAYCDFLKGNTLNKLIDAERIATTFALTKAKRSNFTILLPDVNAYTVGELLMYFMYQTAYAGSLLHIDAYDQPGVEEGKRATFAMLGRQGYEDKLHEIVAQKQTKFMIKE